MENEFGFKVIGFCTYCHGSIYVGDDYKSTPEGLIHTECDEIQSRYYDPMEVGGGE